MDRIGTPLSNLLKYNSDARLAYQQWHHHVHWTRRMRRECPEGADHAARVFRQHYCCMLRLEFLAIYRWAQQCWRETDAG